MSERKVILISGTDGMYDGVHIACNERTPFHTICLFGGDVDVRAVSDNDHKVTCKECFEIWERTRFFNMDCFSQKILDDYQKIRDAELRLLIDKGRRARQALGEEK